jgi:hypothetical protein
MSDYPSSHTMLDLGKARMQEFHQEREALRLAREAQNFRPGRIQNALNQIVSLFKRLALRLEPRLGFGRALREKAIAVLDQTSLR